MSESTLDFAKIAANPTPTTWSQAYNAGNLYAVLSLEKEEEKEEEKKIEEKDFLAILGKGILDTLESEYFALESKDLDSIKNAILITAHKIPEEIKSSFVITAVVKNILYIFILGGGKIYLKRDANFGLILNSTGEEKTTIKAASGYVKKDDVIVLETKQFSDIIPSEKMASTLDSLSPNEVVESLAPTVHGHEQGGAAAIIINFKEELLKETTNIKQEEEKENEDKTIEEEIIEEAPIKTTALANSFFGNITQFFSGLFSKLKFKKSSLNHSKKMYLFIAIIILIVLIFSIFLAIKKQNEAKVKAMFDGVYPQAVKKYDEGQSLVDLNQNIARDNFMSSKKILEENLDKFDKNSNEQKQLLELLTKVENAINLTSGVNSVEAKEIETDESEFLKFVLSSKAIAFGQNDETIYSIDEDGVYSTAKGKDNTKEVIENDNIWENPMGVVPYLSNIYVLDKTKGGVIKFVGGQVGFGKANYFTDAEPDLSDAKSIAIDGSIWILLSDGTVLKYTRGKSDGFSLTGLDSLLSNPTKIYTDSKMDNVYVLDNGNSRIIVFDKEGSYKEQYSAKILSDAKELEILEKDKKILILSSDKVYEININ